SARSGLPGRVPAAMGTVRVPAPAASTLGVMAASLSLEVSISAETYPCFAASPTVYSLEQPAANAAIVARSTQQRSAALTGIGPSTARQKTRPGASNPIRKAGHRVFAAGRPRH